MSACSRTGAIRKTSNRSLSIAASRAVQRRRTDRYLQRRADLLDALVACGLMPPDEERSPRLVRGSIRTSLETRALDQSAQAPFELGCALVPSKPAARLQVQPQGGWPATMKAKPGLTWMRWASSSGAAAGEEPFGARPAGFGDLPGPVPVRGRIRCHSPRADASPHAARGPVGIAQGHHLVPASTKARRSWMVPA